MKRLAAIFRVGLIALGLFIAMCFVVTFVRNRPLPPAPDHAFIKPSFDRLPAMSACWIEFDHDTAPGQAATAGFTRLHTWELTASGLLIRHPQGSVLIDSGNSTHFQEEVADYPFWSHLHFEILTGGKSAAHRAPDVLRSSGIDPSTVSAVLLSHVHMDHAGGVMDTPDVPVLLSPEELDFAKKNRDTRTIQVVPGHAREIQRRAHLLDFQPKAYETFDESADLFGDGSVVVVKLPGHTPGSVGTFLNLSPTQRIFHVGDAVNVTEAVNRRLPKSLLMATTDNDSRQADLTVAKLAQLHSLDPALLILPAHDRSAWKTAFGSAPGCIR
ncbi:MBL fold metallo-hydrolase [Acidobacteria bacterium AB60]|nr:MBL fold metallo-hydrolase [Acidobacteria bacterium AB60]